MPGWEFVGDKNICGETGATFQKKVSCSVNRIVPVTSFLVLIIILCLYKMLILGGSERIVLTNFSTFCELEINSKWKDF